MSEWKDALMDYIQNNVPNNIDDLPIAEQDKIYKRLEQEFFENCERAEALYEMGKE